MPIYDYVCRSCAQLTEVIHGIDAPGPRFCPACGAESTLRKAFVAPAVHFKGSGWAKKDRSTATRARSRSDGDGGSTDGTSTDGSSTEGAGRPSKASEGGAAAGAAAGSDTRSGSGGSGGSDSGSIPGGSDRGSKAARKSPSSKDD